MISPGKTLQRLRTFITGGARDPQDPHIFHRISLIAFFAWVGLGADGLSSSCYGPQEAFLALGSHHYLGIFVALGTAITVLVISVSYSQIVELFPSGGGGYLVASKLLSPRVGMVSGCALLIDYVLTIAISIASGADAIFSFLPETMYKYRLGFAVLALLALTIANLRGVKESVLPLVPIFLVFIGTHVFAIVYGIVHHFSALPELASGTVADVRNTATEVGWFALMLMVLRSYTFGAGTFTGIEAVSNGMPILRDPKVKTAKKTMRYMAFSLAFMAFGLMLAYILYAAKAEEGKTLNAVIFESLSAAWNSDTAKVFIFVTLLSEAAILFVAAQAGFLDGPRVLANMALDRWMPTRFATLSDRLVTQDGVLLMAGAALIVMLATKGSVAVLVVLYSINVFITFMLSQLGMVRHWWQDRKKTGSNWKHGLFINGLGLFLTIVILVSVVVLKFNEGGWVTLVLTGVFVLFASLIRLHYNNTMKQLRRLDSLAHAVLQELSVKPAGVAAPQKASAVPSADKTAVIMVNGFNGLGLHTLAAVVRLFGGMFKNYVFVQVGVVDAGNFKGTEEVANLETRVKHDLDRYIEVVNHWGYYAEGLSSIGTDVVSEIENLAPELQKRFPQAVVFGGQLVFREESILTNWLHNNVISLVQRRFYGRGIPFVILPIRV